MRTVRTARSGRPPLERSAKLQAKLVAEVLAGEGQKGDEKTSRLAEMKAVQALKAAAAAADLLKERHEVNLDESLEETEELEELEELAKSEEGESKKYSSQVDVLENKWKLFVAIYGEKSGLGLSGRDPTLEEVRRFTTWVFKVRQRASAVGRKGLGDSFGLQVGPTEQSSNPGRV